MMIMCLSVLPSFASANDYKIEHEKSGENGINKGDYYLLANNNGFNQIAINGRSITRYPLPKNVDISSIYLETYSKTEPLTRNVYLKLSDENDEFLIAYNLTGWKNYLKEFNDLPFEVKNVRYLTLVVNDNDSPNVRELRVSNKKWNQGEFSQQVIKDGTSVPNLVIPLESISDLSSVPTVNDVSFSWKNPKNEKFTGVSVYKDGTLLTTLGKEETSYKVSDLQASKIYYFDFYAMYGAKKSLVTQKTVKTLVDPKTVPPGPVSSLVAEPTDKTVKLKWKSPKDDDLAGFKILQNGKEIAGIGLEEEFIVKNLKPLTEYTFSVIAVDADKNDSSSVTLSVKTLFEKDEEPPHVPSNVFVKPSNGALIASWDKVSDKDLAGYNVYVDDKKVNSNLVSSTNFTIKNLENNRKYKIQVQAVDLSGNASALSIPAYGTPDETTLPIIESNYTLQDVSDGVSVMFGQFWTVLAFAVGIPLAFYIIYKLKHTVLP